MSYQLNIEEYFNSLEGDVWVENITTIPNDAQVRDYTKRDQPFVRRDFTVVDWSYDGVSNLHVFITKDGCIDIHGEYDDDTLFMVVITAAHATLAIDGDIPQSLSDAFLATATERMEYED